MTLSLFLSSLIQGIVQGITESLPVSSSAHVLMTQKLLTLRPDHTLVLALHVGTLLSALCYFWREVWSLLQEAVAFVKEQKKPTLLLTLILSTLPVAVVGILIKSHVDILENSLVALGCCSIFFGILLGIADRMGGRHAHPSETPSFFQSIIIGAAQILALLPGVSRLGATITMGRFLGVSRKGLITFSFLLSLPATGGGVLLMATKAMTTLSLSSFLPGVTAAFLAGLLALRLFVPWMEKNSLIPLAFYRVIFGIFVLLWAR